VARTGYTGEDGFEVFCPAQSAVSLWRKLLEAGSAVGIAPVGLGARDTLRLEARMPLYGHELTDNTSPWQAGLARVVKTDKPGGFVGQEALLRRKGNERQRLVGLVLEGKRIARDGMAILVGGQPVGTVTSGTFAPSLERGIAMGYVDREHGEAGTRLVVDVRGKEAPAVVVAGAFYKRDY
jgi:aminomethyltransferase